MHIFSKKMMILFLMIALCLILTGCMPDKDPLIIMKFKMNVGMEGELLVDEINEEGIVYRYFGQQHSDNPSMEQEFIPFEELFQIEGEGDQIYPVYPLHLFLEFDNREEEFIVPEEFDTQFREDPAFREYVGSLLNKPFGPEFRKLLE